MQNQQEKKRGGKTAVILLIILVILLLGVLGGGFYYLNRKATAEKEDLQKKTDELSNQKEDFQKQIDELKSRLEQKTEEGEKEEAKETEEKKEEMKETAKKETTPCSPTLASSDKLAVETWKTYENSKYSFSFKHPEDWQVTTKEDNLIVLKESEAQVTLEFRMAEASYGFGIEPYTKEIETSVDVACVKGTKTVYSGEQSSDPNYKDKRMTITKFEKDGTPYLIMISYKYIGASLSSDIVEAYDLILKSLEFK